MTRAVAHEALDDAGVDGADAQGHRDHQPARDGRWPGTATPASRCTARSCGRTAAPPPLRRAEEAGHEAVVPRAHRPRARPLLLRHEDRVAAREGRRAAPTRRFGTIDAWLVFKLTRPRTRPTTPTRRARCCSTSASWRWDEELCELLGVPVGSLPEPLPERPRLWRDHRVRRVGAGGRASPATSRRRSTGRPATSPGSARTPTAPAASCSRTRAPSAPPPARACSPRSPGGSASRVDYALEAAIFVTGAAVQWLRDGLGIIEHRRRDRGAGALARLATTASTSCPALTGLGLAALGPVRARDDRRADARHRRARTSRAPRWRRSPTRRSTPCARRNTALGRARSRSCAPTAARSPTAG